MHVRIDTPLGPVTFVVWAGTAEVEVTATAPGVDGGSDAAHRPGDLKLGRHH
jgi:hypothetical protein